MKRKTKRKILLASVWVAVITYFVSICMLDSESWIPIIVCFASLAWLIIMAWANGFFEGGEK